MKLGIDIDDVLNPFTKTFCDYYGYDINDFFTYRYWEVLGCSHDEANKLVLDFYKTKEFREMEPMESAREVIMELSSKYGFFSVTGRPVEIKKLTQEWMEKYFPLVSSLHFTNNYGVDGKNKALKKEDAILVEGSNLFIEDNKDHIEGIVNSGIKVVVFNRPWNKGYRHKNAVNFNNWNEIGEYLGNI